MKVFHVLNRFFPQKVAGTEIYAFSLCRFLHLLGVNVSVVIPIYDYSRVDYLFESIPVLTYEENARTDRALIMGRRDPEGLKNFIELLNQHKPDVVHFHEISGSNGITMGHVKAVKEFGAKIIITFHLSGYSCSTGTMMYKGSVPCDGKINYKKCAECNLDYRGFGFFASFLVSISQIFNKFNIDSTLWDNKLGNAFGVIPLIRGFENKFRSLLSYADSIVVISKWYERVLALNGIDMSKVNYIPQGLPNYDSLKFANCKTHTHLPLKIIFLGRIIPVKGLHLLLEALLDIDESLVELDIFGPIYDSLYLLKCQKLSLNKNNIHWKGELNQNEVVSSIKNYDILCLCSVFSEMSPLVIQEAFASGVPVLASDVAGNIELIVDGHNGWLFRFNDVDSLRLKIKNLISNPEMIVSARKKITMPVTFNKVAEEYLELYNSLHS